MHFPSKIDPSSNFFAILFSAFTAVVIVVAVAKRSLPLYLLSAVIAFVCIYYSSGHLRHLLPAGKRGVAGQERLLLQ